MSALKEISQRVTLLRREICSGKITSVDGVLQGPVSPELLLAIREQKILLASMERETFDALAQRLEELAGEVLSEPEAVRFKNYLALVVRSRSLFRSLTVQSQQILDRFPVLPVGDLIRVCERVMLAMVEEVVSEEQPSAPATEELADLAATSERKLHEFSGHVNDIAFAAARALNEASRTCGARQGSPGRSIRASAEQLFSHLVTLASQWNSIEYALDQVTYGHWYVDQIDSGTIRFGFVDHGLILARRVGIRRRLVDRYTGKTGRPRMSRQILSKTCDGLVLEAVAYYELRCRRRSVPLHRLNELRRQVGQLLIPLDAEDDLLLAGAAERTSEVLNVYFAALAMRVFREAADFVRPTLPKRTQRELDPPSIPADQISQLLEVPDERRQAVRQAIAEQTTPLPAKRHWDLIRRPFVLTQSGSIEAIGSFDTFDWPKSVREQLIDGGGLGKRIGHIWEEFITKTLEQGGWEILGSGIKLRQDGRVVTDIDLLAMRDGVVLVSQIKAITDSGLNPYDHWKSRMILEQGARQARVATAILEGDRNRIGSIACRRVQESVVALVPIVITTSSVYDGWKCEGVPVLSSPSLSAITDGARVLYRDVVGTVVGSHEIVAGDALSRKNLLSLIDRPLHLRIAGEGNSVRHDVKYLAGIRWEIPDLVSELVDLSPAAVDASENPG